VALDKVFHCAPPFRYRVLASLCVLGIIGTPHTFVARRTDILSEAYLMPVSASILMAFLTLLLLGAQHTFPTIASFPFPRHAFLPHTAYPARYRSTRGPHGADAKGAIGPNAINRDGRGASLLTYIYFASVASSGGDFRVSSIRF
jgi:hypothetical protein